MPRLPSTSIRRTFWSRGRSSAACASDSSRLRESWITRQRSSSATSTRCRAPRQTGQLFLLYDDRLRQIDTWLEQIARTPAMDELVDEFGVTHRLWPISDPDF